MAGVVLLLRELKICAPMGMRSPQPLGFFGCASSNVRAYLIAGAAAGAWIDSE